MNRSPAFYPFMATLLAIALLSLMDAFMKSAALAAGAYSALLVRNVMAVSMVAPAWLWQGRKWPSRPALKIHFIRGIVAAFMSLTFFSALVHLPIAEAIAISFISPLLALGLAAIILKETIGRKAIVAAILGFAGVAIIVGGRIGAQAMTDDAAFGVALVLVSALLYAWNLVLQRQQALLAKPVEITTFQTSIVSLILLLGAPFFFVLPRSDAWLDIFSAAVLGLSGGLILAWSYARAEAQVLVPIEYTGFLWAALFGWLFFAEALNVAILSGAALIIVGCWIAAPRKHPEQVATGAAAP